ncbi:hypothetical protein VN97_g12905, partial [Penicillium thymicola]
RKAAPIGAQKYKVSRVHGIPWQIEEK